jgi:hypothetical protein
MGRTAIMAATAAGVFGLTLSALAVPATAAPARQAVPAAVAGPAAPLDDVLEGPFPPAQDGIAQCHWDQIYYINQYPDEGCVEALRRGQYAYWIITDAVQGT